MTSGESPLTSVLDALSRSAGGNTVSIGNVIDVFEHRSLGVLLTLFGLIPLLPVIGDIPGMATLTGTLGVIAIVQSFLAEGGLWLLSSFDEDRRQVSRE